jgi:pimeloyl-ACP methyl ester carboxylesterase
MSIVITPATTRENPEESVLLLHCSASSGRQWDGLAATLGAAGFRALAPDLYGYGEAPGWSGPGPLKLSAESARIQALLSGNDEPMHVVGHSYGGAVALRLAVEQPWRVKSLTLIEPVAFHALRRGGRDDRRLFDSVHRFAASVIRRTMVGDYHGALGRFVDYWNGRGAWDRMRPETRRDLSRYAPKLVLDFHAAVTEGASLNAYRRRLAFPVLVIRGALSPAPTRRIAERLAQTVPGASLETVHDAGHMLPLTHPDWTRARVMDHIGASYNATPRAA